MNGQKIKGPKFSWNKEIIKKYIREILWEINI